MNLWEELLFWTFTGILEEENVAEKPEEGRRESLAGCGKQSRGHRSLGGEAFSLSSSTDLLYKLGQVTEPLWALTPPPVQ